MTSTRHATDEALSPARLQQLSFSFAAARVLSAGVQLKIFTHLAEGCATADEVARAAGASARGTRMLLDALVGLELCTKAGGLYGLTPEAAEFLVVGRPNYVGALMETPSTWETWGRLTEVVRTGRPVRHINEQSTAADFFPRLIGGLHVFNLEPARRAARVLEVSGRHRGARVLDVACGTAVWSLAVAAADETATVTAQDFPEVLAEARRYVAARGFSGRYEYLPGDLREVELGRGRFDLAIVGNILHSLGERASRELLARLHDALAPGGRVAIVEKMPNDERTGPAYPLFFALNMLINTEEGDAFTLAQLTEWLSAAGFRTVETADIGMASPLVISRRL